MKLRYGIISCASIVDRFISAIQAYGDEVFAIAARDIKKAENKASKYHIHKAYGSYQELYDDSDIDIVYIATNNGNHANEVIRALHAGKHVVCEKPLALSKQDATTLFTIAKEKKRFLMEAQKSVFLPATIALKEIIMNHQLGALHQVEMSSSFPTPSAAWMHDASQGGVVYGSASYTIEYLDYLIEPTHITTNALGILEEKGACERVSMNFIMDDVLINSRISMHGDTKHHALFYFTKGYVKVPSYWKARHYEITQNEETTSFTFPVEHEMVYEVAHIHECIENKLIESPIMNAKRSILCCELVDEINTQINKRTPA